MTTEREAGRIRAQAETTDEQRWCELRDSAFIRERQYKPILDSINLHDDDSLARTKDEMAIEQFRAIMVCAMTAIAHAERLIGNQYFEAAADEATEDD